MKRFLPIVASVIVAASLIVAAIAVARPGWLSAAGAGAAEDVGLYCKEHGVPEKFCTLCHEELKTTLQACAEHGGLPEAICTLCHPDAEKKYKLEMCPKGHGLPREFCVKCTKAGFAAETVPAVDDGWCATHEKPEAFCLECVSGALGAARTCNQPLPNVRLASAKLAEQIGLQTAAVFEEDHAHTLAANAETAYDANRYAEIAPRVGGFLREVRADLGKAVTQGEVLAVVDSSEVSGDKAQYIGAQAAVELAQAARDRTDSLAKTGIIAGKSVLEALTALNQAKAASLDAEQKLRNFGFTQEQITRVVEGEDTGSSLDVVSPLDGVVVARHAVQGEPVQATSQLFAVADTSKAWLWIDVYESDIDAVKAGQRVTFAVSGGDQSITTGAVNWVGTEVNPQTRTTRVRAELSNPDGRLRANQFGQAVISVGDEHKAVIVPKAAVQRKDGVDVVFLPQAEAGVYRPQRVVAKPSGRGDVLEVAWGLKPGQRVVTKGAFLLKTEIMKGAIGAGCCE